MPTKQERYNFVREMCDGILEYNPRQTKTIPQKKEKINIEDEKIKLEKENKEWEHSFNIFKSFFLGKYHNFFLRPEFQILTKWIIQQRIDFINESIEDWKIEKLNSCKFWAWNLEEEEKAEKYSYNKFINEFENSIKPKEATLIMEECIKDFFINENRYFLGFKPRLPYYSHSHKMIMYHDIEHWNNNENWQETFDKLISFLEESKKRSYNRSQVRYPRRQYVSEEEENLSLWVQKQRRLSMYLDDDQTTLLESLPDWSWNGKPFGNG